MSTQSQQNLANKWIKNAAVVSFYMKLYSQIGWHTDCQDCWICGIYFTASVNVRKPRTFKIADWGHANESRPCVTQWEREQIRFDILFTGQFKFFDIFYSSDICLIQFNNLFSNLLVASGSVSFTKYPSNDWLSPRHQRCGTCMHAANSMLFSYPAILRHLPTRRQLVSFPSFKFSSM